MRIVINKIFMWNLLNIFNIMRSIRLNDFGLNLPLYIRFGYKLECFHIGMVNQIIMYFLNEYQRRRHETYRQADRHTERRL